MCVVEHALTHKHNNERTHISVYGVDKRKASGCTMLSVPWHLSLYGAHTHTVPYNVLHRHVARAQEYLHTAGCPLYVGIRRVDIDINQVQCFSNSQHTLSTQTRIHTRTHTHRPQTHSAIKTGLPSLCFCATVFLYMLSCRCPDSMIALVGAL